MKLPKLFNDFVQSDKAGGMILIFVTVLSLALSNSCWQSGYTDFWNIEFEGHSLVHWINDGLMTIFFLLIGLELEREVYQGELSTIKNAALPIFGALGGMIVPAGIFLLLNYGTTAQSGAGIPMATDIAFAVGILSLLGNRVPSSLKIFLTALAVIDDLGAVIVIAICYTTSISLINLLIALSIFTLLLVLNRLKIHNLIPYLIGGVAMWYFMLQSGVHATITGILLAFAIPFSSGKKGSSSYILEHYLHKPVAFIILPLFALANTSISLESDFASRISESNSLGIIAGLVIGKPLGIFMFSFVAASIGLCKLPIDLKWKNILGAAFLGGVGFTMSIFITLLAFKDDTMITESKVAVIIASVAAGLIGFVYLSLTMKDQAVQRNRQV